MNVLTCSKIVMTASYPKALFGSELWNSLSKTELHQLEVAHRFAAKVILDLPKLTRSDICLALIGWGSMTSIIDSRKLLFLGRMCRAEAH